MTHDGNEVNWGWFTGNSQEAFAYAQSDTVPFAAEYQDHEYALAVTDGYGLTCSDTVTVRVYRYREGSFAGPGWTIDPKKGAIYTPDGVTIPWGQISLNIYTGQEQDWWAYPDTQNEAPRALMDKPSENCWVTVRDVGYQICGCNHISLVLYGSEGEAAFWGLWYDMAYANLKYERIWSPNQFQRDIYVRNPYGSKPLDHSYQIGVRLCGRVAYFYYYYAGNWVCSPQGYDVGFDVTHIGVVHKEWGALGGWVKFRDFDWGYL